MVDRPRSSQNPLEDISTAIDESLNSLNDQIDANLNGRPNTDNNPPVQNDENASTGTETAPSPTSSDENSPTVPAEQPTNTEETNQANDVCDGISSAYGRDLKNKKPQAQPKSNWPTPPKKADTKIKAPDGKLLHDMLWNELLKFYEWAIDKIVDLGLDFTTFVLYPKPFTADEKKEDTNDIFAVGNIQYENWKKTQLKNKDEVNNYHQEVIDNLERQKVGAPLVWSHLGEKPAFFDNLFALYREAEANPNSEAAKKMKQIKRFPKISDKIFSNSEKIGHIAYNQATLQEYVNPGKHKNMAKRINENAQSQYRVIMANVNKIRAIYENNPEEMKAVMKRYVLGIADALEAARASIEPFHEKEKKIKKKDKTAITEKLSGVENAINNFVIRDHDGTDKAISQIAENENNNRDVVPIEVVAPENSPENVQQEQRQRGINAFSNLIREHFMEGRLRA